MEPCQTAAVDENVNLASVIAGKNNRGLMFLDWYFFFIAIEEKDVNKSYHIYNKM